MPDVASWSIDNGELRLADADGGLLLTYEEPVIALTPAALSQLTDLIADQQAEIDRAAVRIDNIRIGALRDRIKQLESIVATLQSQAAAAGASSSSSSSGSSSAFNAQEKVLLKAIPRKVEKTCRRSDPACPAGRSLRSPVTACATPWPRWPTTSWSGTTPRPRCGAWPGPTARPTVSRTACGSGQARISYGTQIGAEACFIGSNDKGNFRLITRASSCRQLDVAGTQMREPAIYLAIEGKNKKLEPLRAAGLAYTDASYYFMNFEVGDSIPSRGQPKTPACRSIVH